MSHPTVTIGMPVYNGERYIRESLDSLLAQTLSDFELIISDNASTDATETICRQYASADRRIRYIRQTENRGYMYNFHFVLRAANGEHFMWAAADDVWDKSWLEVLQKQLYMGPSVAFGASVSFINDYRNGNRTILAPLEGSRTRRMLRYYLWSEWTAKPNVIYGLFRTSDLQKAADTVLSQSDDRWGFDNILVFKILETSSLRIDPSVAFYKRVNTPEGFRPTSRTRFRTWKRFGPYLLELIRIAPRGMTQTMVMAVTPVKYMWLLGRGISRVTVSLLRQE